MNHSKKNHTGTKKAKGKKSLPWPIRSWSKKNLWLPGYQLPKKIQNHVPSYRVWIEIRKNVIKTLRDNGISSIDAIKTILAWIRECYFRGDPGFTHTPQTLCRYGILAERALYRLLLRLENAGLVLRVCEGSYFMGLARIYAITDKLIHFNKFAKPETLWLSQISEPRDDPPDDDAPPPNSSTSGPSARLAAELDALGASGAFRHARGADAVGFALKSLNAIRFLFKHNHPNFIDWDARQKAGLAFRAVADPARGRKLQKQAAWFAAHELPPLPAEGRWTTRKEKEELKQRMKSLWNAFQEEKPLPPAPPQPRWDKHYARQAYRLLDAAKRAFGVGEEALGCLSKRLWAVRNHYELGYLAAKLRKAAEAIHGRLTDLDFYSRIQAAA